MTILLVVLVLCLAGFMHGFTGFGAAMTIMALLPLLLDFQEVLFLGAFFTLPVAAAIFIGMRQNFRWRDSWTLIAGAVIGTPLGLLIVADLDRSILVRGLGAVLILFSINELLLSQFWTVHLPGWLGLPIGVVCGILGAAFNIGGPPALIWLYSRPWQREQAIATLQMMFLFNSGLRLILTAPSGVVTQHVILICVLAMLPFLLAAMFGVRLAARISPRRFKQIVLFALMAMGFHYMLRG
jgi:uncharacterized membrane protein YfcA